jgi:type IV pilus assembly protein PilE
MMRRTSGFTLVELMITVVIVAVLASLALASYSKYVIRAHRTEGRNALLALASAQEKYYLANNTYAGTAISLTAAPPTGLGLGLNGTQTQNGWYTVAITAGSANGYTATATTTGSQTTDADCQVFTVTQAQAETATNSGGTDNSTTCWAK